MQSTLLSANHNAIFSRIAFADYMINRGNINDCGEDCCSYWVKCRKSCHLVIQASVKPQQTTARIFNRAESMLPV